MSDLWFVVWGNGGYQNEAGIIHGPVPRDVADELLAAERANPTYADNPAVGVWLRLAKEWEIPHNLR